MRLTYECSHSMSLLLTYANMQECKRGLINFNGNANHDKNNTTDKTKLMREIAIKR